ncbi:MAG: 3-methyladenine DNA glycosylase [Acidobacteria bacterium]|nr:MAG: 3-methyladenine DNA glycosylase [Acidobacteriota bacterium]
MNKLPPSFYVQPTVQAAQALLGKQLVRTFPDGRKIIVRITETEAYHQFGDRASHSYNGLTKRNAAMFETGGIAYVYLIYGIHHCLNVVTEKKHTGAAVLIRAAEPVEGLDLIRTHRNHASSLMDGPGKLTMALKIDRSLNFHRLDEPPLQLLDGSPTRAEQVTTTTRIGISKSKDLPWRFLLSR